MFVRPVKGHQFDCIHAGPDSGYCLTQPFSLSLQRFTCGNIHVGLSQRSARMNGLRNELVGRTQEGRATLKATSNFVGLDLVCGSYFVTNDVPQLEGSRDVRKHLIWL
jgi:hypothetical protein